MKKILAILLSALLVMAMAACGDTVSSSASKTEPASVSSSASVSQPDADSEAPVDTPADTSKTYNINLALNSLDEYQTEWLGYVTAFLEKDGHTVTHTNADGKVDKQLADVEASIQTNPDVIVMRGVDSVGAVPCMEAIVAAGIPVVDAETDIVFEDCVRIYSPNFDLAALQSTWVNEYLAANPDKNFEVGYIWGAQGMSATQDRYDGFMSPIKEGPHADRVKFLIEKVANWSATESMAVVEDWMQAYPNMNLIVAQSDEMAIAAVNVVEAAGKLDDIIILGLDGSPNAQESIRAGGLTGSAFRSRIIAAKNCAETAVKAASGELVSGDVVMGNKDADVFLTIENLDTAVQKIEGGLLD